MSSVLLCRFPCFVFEFRKAAKILFFALNCPFFKVNDCLQWSSIIIFAVLSSVFFPRASLLFSFHFFLSASLLGPFWQVHCGSWLCISSIASVCLLDCSWVDFSNWPNGHPKRSLLFNCSHCFLIFQKTNLSSSALNRMFSGHCPLVTLSCDRFLCVHVCVCVRYLLSRFCLKRFEQLNGDWFTFDDQNDFCSNLIWSCVCGFGLFMPGRRGPKRQLASHLFFTVNTNYSCYEITTYHCNCTCNERL